MTTSGKGATTQQELRRWVALAEDLVCASPVVYADTVVLLLRGAVPSRGLDEIKALCGFMDYGTSRACGSGWPFRLTLQQPQDAALRLVEENLHHIVSEFHVAYDLPTRNPSDAQELTSIIQHLQVQPWHGKRRSRLVKEETAYASQRRTARNLATYGDKPSKVTGGPCCHIELRYRGADACRTRGVRTCGDLLDYDALRHLDHDFKLALIDWQRAYSILRRRADLQRRSYLRNPSRRPKFLMPIAKLTFERLRTEDLTPSFDESPNVPTQRALEVCREWSTALVTDSLGSLLRACARSDYEHTNTNLLSPLSFSLSETPVPDLDRHSDLIPVQFVSS
jgi:hypothetical protein